jgi:hypothetical protein
LRNLHAASELVFCTVLCAAQFSYSCLSLLGAIFKSGKGLKGVCVFPILIMLLTAFLLQEPPAAIASAAAPARLQLGSIYRSSAEGVSLRSHAGLLLEHSVNAGPPRFSVNPSSRCNTELQNKSTAGNSIPVAVLPISLTYRFPRLEQCVVLTLVFASVALAAVSLALQVSASRHASRGLTIKHNFSARMQAASLVGQTK